MVHSQSVRQRILKTLKLQFNFVSYFEIADWQNTSVMELPVLFWFESCIIEEHIKAQMPPQQLFPAFPCHTQDIARAVKLVTKA